jgi:hypothetical protein
MCCDQCGERLEHFEGEAYCPDCTYFEAVAMLDQAADEVVAQFDQATDEEVALLAIDQVDDDAGDRHGERPPF